MFLLEEKASEGDYYGYIYITSGGQCHLPDQTVLHCIFQLSMPILFSLSLNYNHYVLPTQSSFQYVSIGLKMLQYQMISTAPLENI